MSDKDRLSPSKYQYNIKQTCNESKENINYMIIGWSNTKDSRN